MKFKELKDLKPLINSEGNILELVESIDGEEMSNERLYLKALCLKGKGKIYCKVNHFALEMFFQGRLSVKDLFLLRNDEGYLVDYDGNQELVLCDEEFIEKVIKTIPSADSHYYSITEGMRNYHSFTDLSKYLEMMYINGLGSVIANTLSGKGWLKRNGL